ncbi:MAG: ABC transporter ATP-binding protein [Pelovirga sp.]
MSRQHLQIIHSRQGTAPEPVILEVNRLTKGYISADSEQTIALKDLTFNIRQKEMVCLLGRSGCGKTTLLKLLAGFLKPSAGDILLNGEPLSHPGPACCMVFQEDALFPWLTVKENIAFGLINNPMSRQQKQQKVDQFIELVGLSGFGSYLPREISGGMKQRVALARVLILQPRILLMDEPFAALDAQTREQMQKLLQELRRQFAPTILFVTHDVNEALLLGDRVLLFDKNPGRISHDIKVALPQTRAVEHDTFLRLRTRINELLKDE